MIILASNFVTGEMVIALLIITFWPGVAALFVLIIGLAKKGKKITEGAWFAAVFWLCFFQAVWIMFLKSTT